MDRSRIALALLTAATAGCGRASPPDSSTPPVALATVIPLADDRERLGAWIACGAP